MTQEGVKKVEMISEVNITEEFLYVIITAVM